MLNQELLTSTIAGCMDVLRHQPVSKANIILEFLLRHIRDVMAMDYRANICPVSSCAMEELALLDYHQIISSIRLLHL